MKLRLLWFFRLLPTPSTVRLHVLARIRVLNDVLEHVELHWHREIWSDECCPSLIQPQRKAEEFGITSAPDATCHIERHLRQAGRLHKFFALQNNTG